MDRTHHWEPGIFANTENTEGTEITEDTEYTKLNEDTESTMSSIEEQRWEAIMIMDFPSGVLRSTIRSL